MFPRVEDYVEKHRRQFVKLVYYFTFYFGFKEYKPWNKNKNIASVFLSLSE